MNDLEYLAQGPLKITVIQIAYCGIFISVISKKKSIINSFNSA